MSYQTNNAEHFEEEKDEGVPFLPVFLSFPKHKHDVQESARLPAVVTFNAVCFVLLLAHTGFVADPTLLLYGLGFLASRTATIWYIARFHSQSMPEQDPQQDLAEPTSPAKSSFLAKVSVPMASLLTLSLVLLRQELRVPSVEICGQALTQALWWYAFISIIQAGMPNTAANLDTFSLSAGMALCRSDAQGFSTAVSVLMASVTQSLLTLRMSTNMRRGTCAFVACTMLALWVFPYSPMIHTSTTPSHSASFSEGHPIENLIAEQRSYLELLHARQSQTLDAAVREYQRRYHRRPPLGFDKWFELAQEHGFVLVDEFDTLMQNMEPFRGINPVVLQQRVDNILKSDAAGRMNLVKFENGNVSISDDGGDVGLALVNRTWADIVRYNITLMLNTWDEPMVSSPWDEVNKAIEDARDPTSERLASSANLTYVTPFIETGKQNGWAATRQACSVDSPARQDSCPMLTYESPLEFFANVSESMNVCLNCQIKAEHGILISPGNLHVAHELVPIWSASKPSHFNDVMYPSAYYINTRGDYRSDQDSKWEDKDNKFYWVGSSTGGWSTAQTWRLMQRQRLVLETMRDNNSPVQFLEETNGHRWSPRYSTMAEIAHLFSTRISKLVQCEEDACELEEKVFKTKEAGGDSQDAAYAHKFVMDIDGNGFSGRFYRLLRSRSVTIKSTILQEWHDDRLIPWVHYVPLSTHYRELPEMARFLASTERGLELSERIARESTEWHDKALRPIDMQIVFLRMALEYGMVMNPHLTY